MEEVTIALMLLPKIEAWAFMPIIVEVEEMNVFVYWSLFLENHMVWNEPIKENLMSTEVWIGLEEPINPKLF